MHKIVIILDSEADPAEVLEAAQRAAEEIASEVGGHADEDEVYVMDLDPAEVGA